MPHGGAPPLAVLTVLTSPLGSMKSRSMHPTSAKSFLKRLREEVLDANLELVRRGLVLYTFGNASGIAREEGFVVIKPSGVPYDSMKAKDLVITDLDGKIVEGKLRPS